MMRDSERRRPGGRALLLIAMLAGGAPEAEAARLAGVALGRVDDRFDPIEVSGGGVQVFGLDAAGLAGQPARVDWIFDTAGLPADSDPDPGEIEILSTDPGASWLSLSLTVAGVTYDLFDPTLRRVYQGPEAILVGDFRDLYQVQVEHTAPVANGNRREFFDLSIDLPTGTLAPDLLLTTLPETAVDHATNGVAFRINDFELDPATNELISQRLVSFYLEIDSVEITAVPEAEPGPLLLAGLMLLGRLAGRAGSASSRHRARARSRARATLRRSHAA